MRRGQCGDAHIGVGSCIIGEAAEIILVMDRPVSTCSRQVSTGLGFHLPGATHSTPLTLTVILRINCGSRFRYRGHSLSTWTKTGTVGRICGARLAIGEVGCPIVAVEI